MTEALPIGVSSHQEGPVDEFHQQAANVINATWRAAWQNAYNTVKVIVNRDRVDGINDSITIGTILEELGYIGWHPKKIWGEDSPATAQRQRDEAWREWLTDVINPEQLAELEYQRLPPDVANPSFDDDPAASTIRVFEEVAGGWWYEISDDGCAFGPFASSIEAEDAARARIIWQSTNDDVLL